MKYPLLRLFLSFLFLLSCFFLGLWLREKAPRLRTLVQVECESGYVLALEGGDTLYFAEATRWNRAMERSDTLVLLRKMHTNKEQASLSLTLRGVRVKGVGAVQVVLPQLHDTLRGEVLQRLLRDTEKSLRKRLELMLRQADELDYYRRTHSVVDDGYNEVMAFASKLEEARKNEQECLRLLSRALRLPQVLAVKHHRLHVNGEPYFCVKPQGGLSLLLPLAEQEKPSYIAGHELDALLRPHPDTLWHHTDSLGHFYRLQRRDSLWQGTVVDDRGHYYQGALRRFFASSWFWLWHRCTLGAVWHLGQKSFSRRAHDLQFRSYLWHRHFALSA